MSKISDESTLHELMDIVKKNFSDYQPRELDNSITISGVEVSEVEDALNALNGVIPSSASSSNKLATASDIPTTLPASDVYAWAKASTKPAYTASEVGALADTTKYAGSSSAGGAANSVNQQLRIQYSQESPNAYFGFNGSIKTLFNIATQYCWVDAQNWSSTVDADGYYTNVVSCTAINTFRRPIVDIAGNGNSLPEIYNSLPTSEEMAAYDLCDVFYFPDGVATDSFTVKAKTKPTTSFMMSINGFHIGQTA
jgi:hypothetical protein